MNDERPLVSAVVIFLNAERFLSEAIASVFAQTYDRWELLLVDDGSTDAGTAIAKRFAAEQPERVRYLEHPRRENRGMSASRNAGIRAARGDYVAFLDADDVWLPEKLAEQVAVASANREAGMICGATEYWWSWADRRKKDVVKPLGVAADRLHEPPTLSLSLYPLGRGAAPCPSDILIRRDLCERVGGFEEQFRRELQMYEDQAFLAKVYLSAPVYVSGRVWDRYRQHSTSCVSTVKKSGQYHAVRRFFLSWFERYLRDREIVHSSVWIALERALWPYDHPVLASVARFLRAAS
jgi:glycosyltransferase involved in cell wall biosynthesis